MLLAAAVLWAGCSDADKNADKSLEQEKGKTEQSLDVKKENDDKTQEEISMLSVFFVQLGDTLATIATTESLDC